MAIFNSCVTKSRGGFWSHPCGSRAERDVAAPPGVVGRGRGRGARARGGPCGSGRAEKGRFHARVARPGREMIFSRIYLDLLGAICKILYTHVYKCYSLCIYIYMITYVYT